MKKIELNVSEVTSKAWELTKKHGLIIAVVLLAFSLITSSVSMMGFPWGEYLEAVSENDTEAMLAISESMGNTGVLSLLMGLISTILSAGILNIVLQISKGTMSNFNLSGFKMPIMTYVNFILAALAVGVIVAIGTFLCIIPGIYLGVRLLLVPMHILDHPEDGLGGAFKHSWEATKGNFWGLLLLVILYILIGLLGLLCCCVGMFFAAAMGYFMLAVVYLTLCSNMTSADDALVETESAAIPESVN